VVTQWIIFASLLLLNTVVAIVVAIMLARRPVAPGLRSLTYMLGTLAIWNFGYAMITLVPSLEAKRFWLRFENIGILLLPVFWFLFTVQYTRNDRWLNSVTRLLFFIIPLVTLLFVWSDRWFHYYYSAIQPVSGSIGPLVIERGWWYPISTVHAYTLLISCVILLIWRALQYRHIYRRQMFALLGAALFPIAVNVFYQLALSFGSNPLIRVDLTPVSFVISAALIAFGVFGLRIFDLVPIARYTVLEHIPEMIFVTDVRDRVIDANTVAQKMLGKELNEIIGKDPLEVFRHWPQLVNRFLTTSGTREEIQIPGDPPRTLEMTVFELYNRLRLLDGRVIVAHDITEHKWLENDLKYANETLKIQLAEIEALRAELQELAIRDPLTNVYNRRYMSEFLDQEIARASRENYSVTVVIMDMDHFKNFNDNYGHRCGDTVLQAFAKFLMEHTRRSDVVCRFGGEEFVILMPNATLQDSFERVDVWRQDFSETAIDYESMKFSATFSAGLATFPEHGSTGDIILQAADKALYRSKNNGRNRVTRFGD
jgi:diguanylate cyclase (GGDEF)-like protein/PAS domain S-box-containing protein